jgi:hypothetical protein
LLEKFREGYLMVAVMGGRWSYCGLMEEFDSERRRLDSMSDFCFRGKKLRERKSSCSRWQLKNENS